MQDLYYGQTRPAAGLFHSTLTDRINMLNGKTILFSAIKYRYVRKVAAAKRFLIECDGCFWCQGNVWRLTAHNRSAFAVKKKNFLEKKHGKMVRIVVA